MESIILAVFIILILVIHLFYSNTNENFSTSRTNVVFSDSPTNSENDKFAKINEEIMVINQMPDVPRKSFYKYIRTPIDNYLAVYAKKFENNQETLINTVLIKITKVNNEIIPLLAASGVLVDNTSDVRYYVKYLTDDKFNTEHSKLNDAKEVYRKYNICVNSRKSSGLKIATTLCKKEYNILL